MAVNKKDLYGNPGNRFEKINTRRNFEKNTLYLKVSVKENEVPTEKNYSRASIFATKASYISN